LRCNKNITNAPTAKLNNIGPHGRERDDESLRVFLFAANVQPLT